MDGIVDQAKEISDNTVALVKESYDRFGDPVVDKVTDAYAAYAEPYVSPYYGLFQSLTSDEWCAVAAFGLPLLSLLLTLIYLLFRTIFCCGTSKKAVVSPAAQPKRQMAQPPQPPKPRASPPKSGASPAKASPQKAPPRRK